MSKLTVIEAIAVTVMAIKNCQKTGNEFEESHKNKLQQLIEEYLPHGSGIDGEIGVDIDQSTPEKVVIYFEYHLMDENGCYVGWENYELKCTPSFIYGVDIKIKGKNKNDLKDYFYQLFHSALSEELN